MYISKHEHSRSGPFVECFFAFKSLPSYVPFSKPKPFTKLQLSLDDFVMIAPGGQYVVNVTVPMSDYIFVPGQEYLLAIWHESPWFQMEVPKLEGLWGSEHGVLYAEMTVNGIPVPKHGLVHIFIKN